MVIKLSNLQDGQSVALHLPLFIGDTGCNTSDGSITVSNTSLSNSRPIVWPVINGAFKVLVKLKVGENVIQFIHEAQVLVVTVIRYLPELDYFVRPVYIICCDRSTDWLPVRTTQSPFGHGVSRTGVCLTTNEDGECCWSASAETFTSTGWVGMSTLFKILLRIYQIYFNYTCS